MAILGIGTDIVEVARIEKLLEDKPEEFLARVFTDTEVTYCSARARPVQHYAARFAAKEAFMKAVGTGWARGVGFSQIGVVNDEDGGPSLELTGEASALLSELGSSLTWVSLSHTSEYATATVVLERLD